MAAKQPDLFASDPLPTDTPAETRTPTMRRLIHAHSEITGAPPDKCDFLHTVLCQVGMPRRRIAERTFERHTGTASLKLSAGDIYCQGEWVPQPLPYGTHPRLIMVHISAHAVRNQTRVIPIGQSIHDFLIKLGIPTNGGRSGGYTMFKKQMQALAACRLQLGMSDGTVDRTINTQPIERFDAWLTPDNHLPRFWVGEIELSDKFYSTLIGHAVPLDTRALSALKHSALSLDIYTWLAHRLCRINTPKGIDISWTHLKQQFGQEYRLQKDFKKQFRDALRQVCAAYPDARIEDTGTGLMLHHSRPPIPKPMIRGYRHKGAS